MKYLLDMPPRVLNGEAKGIEKWCKANGKAIPTLLDLGTARMAVRNSLRVGGSRRGKGGKRK